MAVPTAGWTLEMLGLAALQSAHPKAPSELEQEVTRLFDLLRDRLPGYLLALGEPMQDGEEIIQDEATIGEPVGVDRHGAATRIASLDSGRPRADGRDTVGRAAAAHCAEARAGQDDQTRAADWMRLGRENS